MTNHVIILRGNRVDLGLMQKMYLPDVIRTANDVRVSMYTTAGVPLSEKKEEEWLERVMTSTKSHTLALLKKEEGGDHKYIGNMQLVTVSAEARVGGTGALIDYDYVDKGYGSEAKMLLLFWAFRQLGFRKIESSALSNNTRSRNYLERTGHKQVGVYKDAYFREGDYVDEVLYELFREDWEPLWEEYKKKYDMKDPF